MVLITLSVGTWPMNCYILQCAETGARAIIDPGADGEVILTAACQTDKILITHGHPDHVGALADVKAATGAQVYMHPADAEKFGLSYDVPLADGDLLEVGTLRLRVVHTPGHTPGAVCFALEDGRVFVGDALFVAGPGHTDSPEEFAQTMRTLRDTAFTWPDDTQFYPGHGLSGRIGTERPAFQAFVERGWSPDLCGDVTWE